MTKPLDEPDVIPCTWPGCERPATDRAELRQYTTGHGTFSSYPQLAEIPAGVWGWCEEHAQMAVEQTHPEYVTCCPNCGCWIPVN